MKRVYCAVAIVIAAVVAPIANAQEFAKPGPEHDWLKKLEGNWDTVMKMSGMESKGKCVYKMDLGGLWLSSSFEGAIGDIKFSGRGLDSYDAGKKKFVGIWVDSMSTTPMLMEGAYDKEKKTLTMMGEGAGPDGPKTKFKTVHETKSDDHFLFSMYMGDTKEPSFTIDYKRAK